MDPLTLFDNEQRRRNLRPGTIERRHRILRAAEAELEGGLLGADAEALQAWLDGCDLSPRSRYTYLSTFRSFFRFCRRHEIRDDDPTLEIDAPRLGKLVPRPIPDADLDHALRQADDRMRVWLCLTSFQGLRCFEVANLRREDILETRDPPLLMVQDGKGGHQAVLTLNEQTEIALRMYGLDRKGWMFTRADGRPYKAGTISTYIARYYRSVGLEATAHQGRHWLATTVWAETHDILVVKDVMRHADVKTSQIYTAFDQQATADVVRGLRVRGPFEQQAMFGESPAERSGGGGPR